MGSAQAALVLVGLARARTFALGFLELRGWESHACSCIRVGASVCFSK